MFSATKKSQKSSAQKSSGFGHFLDASRGELHSRRYFNTYHLFLQAGCLEYNSKCYLSLTYFQQTCSFCREAPRPCTPGILSYEKKVSKDSQGTCWFLDLQQKGESPFDSPSGESSLSRFSRAMTAKVIFYSLPPRMSLCSILQRASVLTRANAACRNYNFAPDQSAKSCPASSWRYL